MDSQYELDVIKAALKWQSTKEGAFTVLCDIMRNYRSASKEGYIEGFKRVCHNAYQECEKNKETLPAMDYESFITEFDLAYKRHEGDLSYSVADSAIDYR